MVDTPTDPCLTAPEDYGNNVYKPTIIYKDDDDLAAKMQAMADSMNGDKRLFINKPGWLPKIGQNCCGGGGP